MSLLLAPVGWGSGPSWLLKASVSAVGTTSGVDTTGADLIVIVATAYNSLTAPTDSKSNTYTQIGATQNLGGGGLGSLWYASAPVVGSGHTFTPHGSTVPALAVLAFSGSMASPLDQSTSGTTASGTSLQPGSITPGSGGELIISGLGVGVNGTGAATINSAFSSPVGFAYQAGITAGTWISYLVQQSVAAINPTWSWTGTAAAGATIASFKGK